MGVVEDRAYFLSLAGLTVDNPILTLETLKAIADMEPHERLMSPYFDDRGQFTAKHDGYLRTQQIDTGEETIPRPLCQSESLLSTTQVLRLTYFTARKTELITQVKMISGGTAAGATPSLIRIGLYTVASNGDLTLVASTATDTALFAAANTAYTKALSASYQKVAGQRYALGLLLNTAAAFPTIMAMSASASRIAVINSIAPLITGSVTAQANLPSTVATASVANSDNAALYCELLP